MDGFLRDLKSKVKFEFQFFDYADDLVFILKESKIKKFLQQLRSLSTQWKFRINKKKSGKLPIKSKIINKEIDQIPIVISYKYLGIQMDSKGQIKQHIKDIERNMNYNQPRQNIYQLEWILDKDSLFQLLLDSRIILKQINSQTSLVITEENIKNYIKIAQKYQRSIYLYYYETSNLMGSINNKDIAISDITLDHLKEELNKIRDQNEATHLQRILLLPKNLQYIFKLAWKKYELHSNEILTAKHIIIKHLNYKSDQEFYNDLKNGMNEITKRKNKQLIKRLIEVHIRNQKNN